MIKKYIEFINERLGVPEGVINSGKKVYQFIIGNMEKLEGDTPITSHSDLKENNLKLGTLASAKIGDITFNNIDISIEIYPNDEDFTITGMSVSITPSDRKLTSFIFDKQSVNDISIQLKYAVLDEKTTIADILNDFSENRARMVSSLSHELKHIYDKYMFGKQAIGDVVSYRTFSDVRFGIKAVDEFIYLLYYTSQVENLVRPTELAAEIDELGITKSEFRGFLKDTPLYKNIKKAMDFKFSQMKDSLYDDFDNIRKVLNKNDIDVPESEKEVVDLILTLIYNNIVGRSADTLKNALGIHPFKIMLGLIENETEDYYNKYIRKISFESKEKYFEYWEKRINFVGEKVFKKISKLYDMCKDNKKEEKVSSIINPEAHDKHVADKQIKEYKDLKVKLNLK
jgi:hypothetical protein